MISKKSEHNETRVEDKDGNPENNEDEDEDDMTIMRVPPRCNMLCRFDVPLGRSIIATVRKINVEPCRMLTVDEGCFTRETRMNYIIKNDIVASCANNADL